MASLHAPKEGNLVSTLQYTPLVRKRGRVEGGIRGELGARVGALVAVGVRDGDLVDVRVLLAALVELPLVLVRGAVGVVRVPERWVDLPPGLLGLRFEVRVPFLLDHGADRAWAEEMDRALEGLELDSRGACAHGEG